MHNAHHTSNVFHLSFFFLVQPKNSILNPNFERPVLLSVFTEILNDKKILLIICTNCMMAQRFKKKYDLDYIAESLPKPLLILIIQYSVDKTTIHFQHISVIHYTSIECSMFSCRRLLRYDFFLLPEDKANHEQKNGLHTNMIEDALSITTLSTVYN